MLSLNRFRMHTRRLLALALLLFAGLALSGCVSSSSNSVVNLSHYDEPHPDFAAMRRSGLVGVIHEATFPPRATDERYAERQAAATRAGLLWGAYHFANATDPIQQADDFVNFTGAQARALGNPRVLLVLDFERNEHYPGGTMSVPQAVAFIQRIHQRTGKYPGLYSNENRVRSVFAGPQITSSEREVLRKCWLWIANYHQKPKATDPWSGWTLWQYTGDGVCEMPRATHPIHCANMRNVERNLFKGSAGDAVRFWHDHAWRVE